MKLVQVYWFTSGKTTGIVIGQDEVTGKCKGYIGTAAGANELSDATHILEYGSPVDPLMLIAILCQLYNFSLPKSREEIFARIDEIEKDERYLSGLKEKATVDVNAPLALIQLALETELQTLRWVLATNYSSLQKEAPDA